MKIGDLIKAKIFTGHPKGIILRVEQTQRWGTLYFVHIFDPLHREHFPSQMLLEHQLEVISESR